MNGVHLHELLELRKMNIFSALDESVADNYLYVLHAEGPRAQCFLVPDVKNMPPPIADFVKLPYPSVWLEWKHPADGSLVGVLLVDGARHHVCHGPPGVVPRSQAPASLFGVRICGAVFGRKLDRWALLGGWREGAVTENTDKQLLTEIHQDTLATDDEELRGLQDDWVRYALRVAHRMLCLINCSNVGRTRVDPPPKLQAARKKRGHPVPMNSYWELKLVASHDSGGEHGTPVGHHDSPRFHFRRGHFRRLHDGSKIVWIHSTSVGDITRGTVTKHYVT